MDRIESYEDLSYEIVKWLKDYYWDNNLKTFVVGVSGGIDSAVVSTLCARTGLPTHAIGMPILQKPEQETLSDMHLEWLRKKYKNVTTHKFDLTNTFQVFKYTMEGFDDSDLALANSRSRLRMVTLYQIATSTGGIVVGTGNKVEDYGVGFYTKYGDGGVDIAPIADLYKTEVWMLGEYFDIHEAICEAPPTDGLWEDGRNDEDQIGATYEQLEEAMELQTGPAVDILKKFNTQNKHKMEPIPTFKLEKV